MTHQCAACGTTFNDADICPNCQLPVKPPELSTAQPSASATPVADAGQTSAEVAGLGGKAAKPERLRLPLVVGIGVASLALVAGVAFAGVKLFAPGGALGGPVQLVVTGEPPSTAGNWANGARETWRVGAAHSTEIDPGGLDNYTGYATASPQAWTVYDFVGDTTWLYTALSPSDGSKLWSDQAFRDCSSTQIKGLIPCLGLVRGDSPEEDWAPALELVNWRTGKPQTTWKLAAYGYRDQMSAAAELTVTDDDIIVNLPLFENEIGDSAGDLKGIRVMRIDGASGRKMWEYQGAGCGEDWVREDPAFRIQHGVYFAEHGPALNVGTGQEVFGASVCVEPEADGLVGPQGDGGNNPPTITAPDGTKMVGGTNGVSVTPLGDVALPPLKLVGYKEGAETGGLMAYDAVSGADRWARPVPVYPIPGEERPGIGEAFIAGNRLLVMNVSELIAIDLDSGAELWRRDIGEARAFGDVLDGRLVLAVQEKGALDGRYTEAIDLDTGKSQWRIDGTAHIAPSPEGGQSLMGFVAGEGGEWVARLDPADRPTKAPVVPSSAPACPAGMTAVSWTQYSDGGILLCHADKKYAVVYPSHPDWQAAQLNFTGGGHEVVFSNGARVRVSLGGSVVYTDADGKTTTQTATEAWNNATGEVKVSVPKDLKTCPANSWPISLSTYNGGWLLVCGTNADAPTSMVYNDGSRTSELGSVSYRNGGYCGTGDVGTVCGYRAPAVVSVTDASGKVTQHSVGGNYFDDHGAGGAGQGTGSYGVEAPTDTAKDQVRYLTQILQKSAAGRANLNAAVAQVRSCSDVAGAVTTINGVIANRQELLDALASTPMDAVPNGSQLVAKLRNALDLSLKSDQVWLQWAQAEQSNSCAEGENSATYKQVETMNESVATAKDAFVAAWNSQIAATYKAPRFATSQI